METARVSSGIRGLDEILHGGFVEGLSYLVRGGPGTGKTQLGLHFLTEGARLGERVLFISLEHSEELLQAAFASLPFDFERITFVSLVQRSEKSGEVYSLFSPSDVEQDSQMNRLMATIDEHRPQRLFVDGFSQMRLLSPNEFQFRRQVLSLLAHCYEQGITTIFSSEVSGDIGDVDLQTMTHGVINLRLSVETGRTLEVTKTLGSAYAEGRHGMTPHFGGCEGVPSLGPDRARSRVHV